VAAESRGPGARHQVDHDSPDEYELDLDSRSRGLGSKNGRIILLGDGTEVLTDSDDTEMFDHSEDNDTENQVSKGTRATSDGESMRSEREGTPAPQSLQRTESPLSTQTEESDSAAPPVGKQASDGARKPEATT
jgi:protein phosphatase PTC2/3